MFTAFLPLKYKSERVDNKNFRIIDDKPLFFYILETISSIELIDEIVIDFDNKSVVENVEKLFKNITFVKRSKNLLDPYESVNNLIKDNLKNFKSIILINTPKEFVNSYYKYFFFVKEMKKKKKLKDNIKLRGI